MSSTPAEFPFQSPILLASELDVARRLMACGRFHRITPAANFAEIEKLATHSSAACVLVSAIKGGTPIPSLIQALRPRLPKAFLVAVSEEDNSDLVVNCMKAGADDFIPISDPVRLDFSVARISHSHSPHMRRQQVVDRSFQTLADSAPALVWITNSSGHFIHFNKSWVDFTGVALEEQLDRGWMRRMLNDDRARFLREFEENFSEQKTFRVDFRLCRFDGLFRWLTCQGIPQFDDTGEFSGYIGSCLDISDQHEAETLLAYRAITQAALAGFGRYALSNHSLSELKQEATRLLCDTLQLDVSEVLLFCPTESVELKAAFSSGLPDGFKHATMEAAVARNSGDSHFRLDEDAAIFPGRENLAELDAQSALAMPINDGSRVIGFLTGISSESRIFGREAFDFMQAIATIISTVHQRTQAELALQESEEKLLQSQKMEAVGQLAGGVAHDFNNLLTAVRCYGDMLHDDLGRIAPDLQSKTAEILKATARASALTRQLLAFSRKQVLQPEILDMNTVVADLRDLVRSMLSENVTLNVTLAEKEACFNADRNQIDQVVLNLCLNARDAMPQNGTLSIAVNLIEISESDTSLRAPPGHYVELGISDTGVGMSLEVQAKLFQPFFTTKPVGRGTGLGLATCAVIVKNCNGYITFDSQVGKGTTFHLYLPRINEPRYSFFDADDDTEINGKESILVVEDDEAIRQITFAILSSLGYQVTVVPGGNDALLLYRSHPVYDLMLTDVIMPEIDGITLAHQIREKHQPGLRILFMSGYLGSMETVQAVAEYNLPFLEKPFTLNNLARKIREALDSPPVSLPPR